MNYCLSLTNYQRRITRTIRIGNVELGGDYPIRLQSMTNTPTRDVDATVAQCIQIIQAGAELVRITAPGIKDAEILKDIKLRLKNMGYQTPVVADIHYSATAAEVAACHVEKIRINPGNYIDKRRNTKVNFSEEEYYGEIQKIKIRISPLIEICRSNHTAMRIGVNHGSLSDRIMDRYGDTPEGMAESAMEFLRICQELDFHDVVVSMKASNTRVMVYANRLLSAKMLAENMNYPIHLGVTEAGEGEDGRIKSAVGIGAMLADGIGETIRVSLTEAPEREIPVARKIVEIFSNYEGHDTIPEITRYPIKPYTFHRRITRRIQNIGGENVPVVIGSCSKSKAISFENLQEFGWIFNIESNSWSFKDDAADYLYLEHPEKIKVLPAEKGIIIPYETWNKLSERPENYYPVFDSAVYLNSNFDRGSLHFLYLQLQELSSEMLKKIKGDQSLVLICKAYNKNAIAELRRLVVELINQQTENPVIFYREYNASHVENFQLGSASETGPLFIDGLGDGLWLENSNGFVSPEKINHTAFGILQASRMRTTKTEFISCPGCGRTLFNLEDTIAKVREQTSHLKGLKIAVMGCIVNGPGEMADADYGYVGAGNNKITLYKNKEIVKKNIPEEDALTELIDLIKSSGDWKERVEI